MEWGQLSARLHVQLAKGQDRYQLMKRKEQMPLCLLLSTVPPEALSYLPNHATLDLLLRHGFIPPTVLL